MSKKIKLSIVAIAIIAIAGTCVGCSDSKTENTSTTVATTTATQATTQPQTTQKPTQAETQAQTEKKATEAPKQNNAEQATQAPAPQNEEYAEHKTVIPNVVGVWKSQQHPDTCSIEITNQSGNTIDFVITYRNGDASKIATAKASVTLDVSGGSSSVTGTGTFDYNDSFGNSGTGIIGVNESVIYLTLTEEYNSGKGWGIAKASGNFLPPYSE